MKISASLKSELSKAKSSCKIKVFLGGDCSDNKWRKELKKDYSGQFFFFDPYDKSWSAEKNIYDELAAIMNSDYVVFLKGGPGSKREQNFMDAVKSVKKYKKFSTLEKLKKFLDGIKRFRARKCVSEYIRELVAKLNGSYSYSSTQVNFPEGLAKKVMDWGLKNISDDMLYEEKDDDSYGREDNIHVTLLYGLTSSDPDEVKEFLRDIKPFQVKLGKMSAFQDKDDYDVLKIEIISPEMSKLHYGMEDALDNKNSYPEYKPHTTVAYLKKGEVDKFLGDSTFEGESFEADSIVFSSRDGGKTTINLKSSK